MIDALTLSESTASTNASSGQLIVAALINYFTVLLQTMCDIKDFIFIALIKLIVVATV